jgi:hypothetical protein
MINQGPITEGIDNKENMSDSDSPNEKKQAELDGNIPASELQ